MKAPSRILDHSQRGFSLVELMVGLTVSLVISLGLFMMVASTSNAFKVQDDFARLQENGAAALRYLVDDIRMAGFYGLAVASQSVYLDNATLTTAGIGSITDDCAAGSPSPLWSLNLQQPIVVQSGLTPATVNTQLACIQANDFAAGNTSVIILRGATGLPIASLDANTLYVQSSPNQDPNTVLFRGGEFANMKLKNAGLTRILDNGAGSAIDAPIFEYQSHVYYLRPCSRPKPPSKTCSPALDDDGGHSIPTLVRHELVDSTLTLVPLVEGVERINMLYGIDSNNDGVVEQFTAAPTTASEWAQVVSVRIYVLVRTASTSLGYSDANKSYDLGGITFTCTPNVDCNFRRHVFSQIASVRNCAQRRGGSRLC